MSIIEYQSPKILFIKNVFINDCILMDDLMEQKLMDEANETAETKQIDDKYTKLPTIFTNIKTWPKKTDILCWNCDRTFLEAPVFIPKTMEPNSNPNANLTCSHGYLISTEGCFCSFNCAMTHILRYYSKSHEKINKIGMLKLLFKEFHGITPIDIISAPMRFEMVQYNGTLTLNDYGLIIKDLQRKSGLLQDHNLFNKIV
jgi:hypothetical protein